MTFIPICFIILASVSALADGVTGSADGQRGAVPNIVGEVERAPFGGAGAQQGARMKAAPGPAGDSDASPVPETKVWHVGTKRTLRYPSDAAKVARDGDIVEIDVGTYLNDYATWNQNDITIRGLGGFAHLKSNGLIPNGKAIWILNGNNILIEHVEFSGAAVRHTNGAGIRHQGGDLTLHDTFFHDNEFSILSGRLPNANIEITSSRFWFQKRPRRHSHGIYIGRAGRLSLIGNHFKGTDTGHQVKSRASENHILYNRIADVPGGNSSRLIDLPNCGWSLVMGNDLLQAETSENFNAIGYGAEGCSQRSEQQRKLYVLHNTFVNEARSSTFVRNFNGKDVLVANNLTFGTVKLLSGGGVASNNIGLSLSERERGSWSAPLGSAAIDAAEPLPELDGWSPIPTREFAPPIGTRARPKQGPLDLGSHELGL